MQLLCSSVRRCALLSFHECAQKCAGGRVFRLKSPWIHRGGMSRLFNLSCFSGSGYISLQFQAEGFNPSGPMLCECARVASDVACYSRQVGLLTSFCVQ